MPDDGASPSGDDAGAAAEDDGEREPSCVPCQHISGSLARSISSAVERASSSSSSSNPTRDASASSDAVVVARWVAETLDAVREESLRHPGEMDEDERRARIESMDVRANALLRRWRDGGAWAAALVRFHARLAMGDGGWVCDAATARLRELPPPGVLVVAATGAHQGAEEDGRADREAEDAAFAAAAAGADPDAWRRRLRGLFGGEPEPEPSLVSTTTSDASAGGVAKKNDASRAWGVVQEGVVAGVDAVALGVGAVSLGATHVANAASSGVKDVHDGVVTSVMIISDGIHQGVSTVNGHVKAVSKAVADGTTRSLGVLRGGGGRERAEAEERATVLSDMSAVLIEDVDGACEYMTDDAAAALIRAAAAAESGTEGREGEGRS